MVWTPRTQTIAAAISIIAIAAFVVSARPQSAPPPPAAADSINSSSTPNHLRIPRLGIEAPIQYVSDAREDLFQRALQDGVVHFPGTAKPGELGNAYLFGHSSDFAWTRGSYKTIFRPLPRIRIGDEILITDASGALFTYIVTATRIVNPRDTSVLDQGVRAKKLLTLQTSYPISTALKRFIVIAERN